jgi:hypothetical protein
VDNVHQVAAAQLAANLISLTSLPSELNSSMVATTISLMETILDDNVDVCGSTAAAIEQLVTVLSNILPATDDCVTVAKVLLATSVTSCRESSYALCPAID